MIDPLHSLPLLLTAFAQWRIGRLWMAHAGRAGVPRRRARLLLGVYYAALAAGLALSFSLVTSALGINRWFGAAVGGLAHLWGYSSTGAYFIFEVVRFVRTRLVPRPFSPARRRMLNAASGALIAAPLLAVGYGALVERTRFRVREVNVPLPDLPPDLEGLRIVQISDIHLSAFLSEEEFARVVDAANQVRPHLAVVTGDMISTRGDPLGACLRQIARLRSDAGVLACMGNHENYARAKEYATREGARLGIRFLRGQNQRLRFGRAALNVAGVDYQTISSRSSYLRGAQAMLASDAVNVLLSHNPDVFPVAAAQGYDLTLSGHTHGGQVTVEILDQALNPARFLTPYVYGLYREGGRAAYVTRGVGTIGIPARIGAPPEVAVIRLRRATMGA